MVLNGLGGLLVAATMKYADNIAKCFAAALSVITGTLFSVPLFGFSLSSVFALGATFTVVASTIYSLAPEKMPCDMQGSGRAEPAELQQLKPGSATDATADPEFGEGADADLPRGR